ncbi:hypothetical protein FPCIR_4337 [Fusarium pseudocircinatum]|uniref:Uncharacterized protein n=1 Tax=Fusarium pseudocircinatum TaxID=56676 RepID=A0A8H5UQV0_9HYPO|nr:hypothetical protein FPCIR_4337 [Fusarium pseudocircinatum]
MPDIDQKTRLISQLQSTLTNHADAMSLLPPNDSIVSKMREINSMLEERITSLENEVGEAESSTLASEASTGSAQGALPITPGTPVPTAGNDVLAGPQRGNHRSMDITPEEIQRFGQRQPPLQIVAAQAQLSASHASRNSGNRRNRQRGPFRSNTLNKMAPTPVNTPFLGKPMK